MEAPDTASVHELFDTGVSEKDMAASKARHASSKPTEKTPKVRQPRKRRSPVVAVPDPVITPAVDEPAQSDVEPEKPKRGRRVWSEEEKVIATRKREIRRIMATYMDALAIVGSTAIPDMEKKRKELHRVLTFIEGDTDPIKKLIHIQRRNELIEELKSAEEIDFGPIEAAAVEIMGEFAETYGISYPAFREIGVPAQTLKLAGIKIEYAPRPVEL